VGIFQLLVMNERLEQLASEKAPRELLDRAAVEEGMRPMWDDGVAKVAAGITTFEELARVCLV
jgi:type II secretory ATPase GspE/PulE/Tfp pilus assembly ATPase PilB-like protein